MTSRFEIEITDSASKDLRWLADRIGDHNNQFYAKKFVGEIFDRLELLRTFPYLGPEEPNLLTLNQGHRFLIKGNVKIIYRVIEDRIVVTDFFDSRQNPERLINRHL